MKTSKEVFNQAATSDRFNSGNKYFFLYNFGIFEFLEIDHLKFYKKSNISKGMKGDVIGISQDSDFSEFYLLFIAKNLWGAEKGVFVISGKYIEEQLPHRGLKKPVKVANNLTELFKTDNIEDKLCNKDEIYSYEEYVYSIGDTPAPSKPFVIQPKDLIELFQEYSNHSIVSNSTVYSPTRILEFFNLAKLKTDIFDGRPYQEDYAKLVSQANELNGKYEFIYCFFYPAHIHGLMRYSNLSQKQISELLKLGLIYNCKELPTKAYS